MMDNKYKSKKPSRFTDPEWWGRQTWLLGEYALSMQAYLRFFRLCAEKKRARAKTVRKPHEQSH